MEPTIHLSTKTDAYSSKTCGMSKMYDTAICGAVLPDDADADITTYHPDLVDCPACLKAMSSSCEGVTKRRRLRGCDSEEQLAAELREVQRVSERQAARILREEQSPPKTVTPRRPKYFEHADCLEEPDAIEPHLINEAWARYHASDVDCDEWEEEQLLRGKEPDWSSFWVYQANVTHGLWEP